MEEAKSLLKTCGPDVDIILARDPDQQIQAESQTNATTSAATAGKVIERYFFRFTKSAANCIYIHEKLSQSTVDQIFCEKKIVQHFQSLFSATSKQTLNFRCSLQTVY